MSLYLEAQSRGTHVGLIAKHMSESFMIEELELDALSADPGTCKEAITTRDARQHEETL